MKSPNWIWVDTDIALGAARGDVDDGFALAAVARAIRHDPVRWRLAGVSAVAGNADAITAQRCARELLLECGIDYHPLAGLAAAEAIASLPDDASLLALGPLTNVAHALRLDPHLPRRVELRVVATVRDRRRHPLLGFFCLNFRRDPQAARDVMRARFSNLRIFPLDVISRLRVGRRQLDQLATHPPLGAYLARHSRRWLRQAPWRYATLRFPAWDLVAALEALDALPGARFDGSFLTSFDPRAAWEAFAGLIADQTV